jgi:GTP-binding protein YchF
LGGPGTLLQKGSWPPEALSAGESREPGGLDGLKTNLYNAGMILTIFGYPKSGKTLLFNLLTQQQEEVSKFSTSSHDYHKAIVDVPDPRLTRLAGHFNLPPVYAKIEFLDTGALAFGESKNVTFIDLLRRADGLVHMIRAFADEEIPHPRGSIDPVRDMKTMEDELKTVDFITIEKRLEKLVVDVMKIKSKELAEELELMRKLKTFLEEEGKPLREYPFSAQEEHQARGFKFLSQKPLLNIINTDETTYQTYLELKKAPGNHTTVQVFCGKIEHELLELEKEERLIFQEEYGLGDYEYVKDTFVQTSYSLLNLISFFTIGKEETRAWTLQKNDNAYTAAGKIHTDIQQGFIRSETIDWQDLLEAGSFSQAREKGSLRLEGKDYLVKDGEVLQFRFNK